MPVATKNTKVSTKKSVVKSASSMSNKTTTKGSSSMGKTKKTSTSKLSTTKVKNSGKLAWFKRLGRMQQRSLVVLLVALVGVGGFLTYRSFAGGSLTLYPSQLESGTIMGNNGLPKAAFVNDKTGSGSSKRSLQARELTTYSQYVRPFGNTLPASLFAGQSKPVKYCYTYKALKNAVVYFIPPDRIGSGAGATADSIAYTKAQDSIKASSDYKTICKEIKPGYPWYGAPAVHLESGGPVRVSSITVYSK